jgi:hypothetical protein
MATGGLGERDEMCMKAARQMLFPPTAERDDWSQDQDVFREGSWMHRPTTTVGTTGNALRRKSAHAEL